jgi:multiple sugar transport system permease protein
MVACLLPLFVSPVIAARLWMLLLASGSGPVDFLYSQVVGRSLGIDWSISPWGYVTVVLVDVWQWTPFMFLILLVGLTSIPGELHEAADLDGARPLRSLTAVTLPLIVPYVAFAVVVRFIDAAKLFEVPYTLTQGLPNLDMYTLSYYLYQNGFISFYQDFAAAGSWLFVLTLLAVALPLLYFLRGEDAR